VGPFVLVHSPLVGPLTWSLVADELRHQGFDALAPALPDASGVQPPYWKRHAEAVVDAIDRAHLAQPPILVGHSGAGVLLPAIRETLRRPVAGYIFVDAGLPENGKSRLASFSNSEAATQFRESARDGLLPTWTEVDLRDAIPDASLRHRFVEELRPLPLAVYEEPIPVFKGWPDAPCAYLRFTLTVRDAYEESVRQAKGQGWAYNELEGGHFHMLVDPAAVARALPDLARVGA
jgi:pimeloyl-ACP methyl ester carboxylesterase